jgi:hypothetical protein
MALPPSPAVAQTDDAVRKEPPIRRGCWFLAIGLVLLTLVMVPLYVASNQEGITGQTGMNGPGGGLFGGTYLPVLPLLGLGMAVLVWNPVWRRLANRGFTAVAPLVLRGRELLLLLVSLYAVVATWKVGSHFTSLFINESLTGVASKSQTWQDLQAAWPPGLGFPATETARRTEPPDEAAIRLMTGLQERGEATQADAGDESGGWWARWRGLTTPLPGPTGSRSPLMVALRPVLATSLIVVIAAAVVLGLVAATARQWTHHERLQHPLTQVPLALIRPGLFRDRGFQVALVTVLAVVGFNFAADHGGHPLPRIPYGTTGGHSLVNIKELYQMFGVRVPAPARWLYESWWGAIHLSPLAIGLAFLIALDVGFTLWGGFFFGALICGWLYRAGVPVNYQHHGRMVGGGATLAMAAVILWMGRHHYWRLLVAAFGAGGGSVGDRTGVWGVRAVLAAGCLLGMLLVLLMHGFDPTAPITSFGPMMARLDGASLLRAMAGAAIGLSVFFAIVLVSARAVAETGLANFELPIRFNDMLLTLGLPYLFPVQILVLMGWIGSTMGSTHTNPAGFLVQATVLGERAALPARRLFPLLAGIMAVTAIAGLLAIIIAWWLVPGSPVVFESLPQNVVTSYENLRLAGTTETSGFLSLAHHLGLEGGFLGGMFGYLAFLTDVRNGPLFYAFLVGAGLILACFAMRRLWVGFPLNPLGVVIAVSWPIYQVWGSLLLGWTAKLLILRYGGAWHYTRLKPMAIGLICGDVFGQGFEVLARTALFYAG